MRSIRLASESDASECLEIYTHYVEQTAFTFETNIPTLSEFTARINSILDSHCWLVCESDGKIIGYAYASIHRKREAYRFGCETSIYLSPEECSKGVGSTLYSGLLRIIKAMGYTTALAGITIPNQLSEEFHRKMGFVQFATYKDIGFKFGQWHDTKWYSLILNVTPSPHLRTLEELKLSGELPRLISI